MEVKKILHNTTSGVAIASELPDYYAYTIAKEGIHITL